MMQNQAPNVAIPVTVMLSGEGGEPIIPTALRWRVLDENDAEVLPWATLSLPSPAVPSVTVTVPSGSNQIPTGAVRAIRRVQVEVTHELGIYIVSESYLLQGETALVFGVNSFLTFGQAQLLALDFPSNQLRPWLNALTKDDQEQALIHAHSAIVKMPLLMEFVDDQQRISVHPWGTSQFEDLTPAQIQDLHPRMLAALKRAQIIQASYSLSEDGVNAQRKNGLMSMTVGESSQFFRPSKPLDLGLCREAYRELARWLDRSIRIGRG